MMGTLITLGLKSLLIAGVTLAILHLSRRRSAADRSWIAHLGLFALVALPLASLALPALSVELPAAMQADAPAPLPATVAAEFVDPPIVSTAPLVVEAAAVQWAPYAYAIPAIALLLITLVALLRLFGLRGRAQVLVDPVWLSALAHAQRRMGFKNGTALLTSSELSSPISWGLMRPVILLNDEALSASGEAEAIIAHELAHVARLDWAKLMLARVATAVFWFNPLAWVLAREAHQLREEAADDAVLGANIADTDYAQLLVGVARHECRGLLLGAHGISPGKGSLRRRVSRVLDSSLSRASGGRSWVAGFAAGMLVMAAPLAALTFSPRTELPEEAPMAAKIVSASQSQRAAPINPALGHTISNAVSSAVATAMRSSRATTGGTVSEELTRQIASEVETTLANSPGARGAPTNREMNPVESAIGMKIMGVTPADLAAIRAIGPHYRHLNNEEIIELKVTGVTPEFVRSLARAGYPDASPKAMSEAAILGVNAEYIREIGASGYRGLALKQLADMRTMGVDRAFIEQVRRAGFPHLDVKQLIEMRIHGVRPQDLGRERDP